MVFEPNGVMPSENGPVMRPRRLMRFHGGVMKKMLRARLALGLELTMWVVWLYENRPRKLTCAILATNPMVPSTFREGLRLKGIEQTQLKSRVEVSPLTKVLGYSTVCVWMQVEWM